MAKNERLSLEELLEQALVKEEDQPYAVPGNWVWVKLDYLCKYIQRGKSPKYSTIEAIPVISQKCIQWTGFDLTKARFIEPSTISSYVTERFVQPMDLLWNSTGNGTVGRINYYSGDSRFTKVVTDSHVTIIRPIKNKISPKKLFYWFTSPYIQDKIGLLTSGTTNQIELNTSTIKDLPIPLPPLPEQQRIVVLIESLFEKLDRAKELAQNALDSFENRKSAILHKAFTGELTNKWREDNEVTEDSTALIDRILEHRKDIKIKSTGEIIRKSADYIPDGWLIINLGVVVREFKYGVSEKSDANYNGIPVLRIPNISSNLLDLTDLKYLDHSDISKEHLIQKNDLLIIRSNGSRELVGKCALVNELDKPYTFASYLIRIRPIIINAKYLLYLLNSSFIRNQFFNKAKSSAGINNINSQELSSILIPLPPLSEQQEIVRILDNLLEDEQKAKELCDVIDKIDHMKKSILARAFRGDLSTNDPAEESAVELLKEVLKEKV